MKKIRCGPMEAELPPPFPSPFPSPPSTDPSLCSVARAQVRQQLGGWFGTGEVATWKLLRVYRIPFAQPSQARRHVQGAQLNLDVETRVCGLCRTGCTKGSVPRQSSVACRARRQGAARGSPPRRMGGAHAAQPGKAGLRAGSGACKP
jgi:histone acetyltransferase MYST1